MTPQRATGGPAAASAPGGAHVVVVAGGDLPARANLDAAWPGWDDGVSLVVAADGGLSAAAALGLGAAVLVGDLDSADPADIERAMDDGLAVVRSPVDKDESDTELALLEAVRRGAGRITVLGALGGTRLDHALANVWLLAHPALASVPATLLDDAVRVSLVRAPGPDGSAPVLRPLPGRTGAAVSLLPLGGDVVGVTTAGLRYPLRDEPLVVGPARGLSNIRTAPDASVAVRQGRLLVVEAARAVPHGATAASGLSSGP